MLKNLIPSFQFFGKVWVVVLVDKIFRLSDRAAATVAGAFGR